jgi:gliding motility-associated-like protein
MFQSVKYLKIAGIILILFCCITQKAKAQAPTAAFDVNDSIVCISNTVSFTDMSTPGGVAITGWEWSFGDGGTSTSQNPNYAYAIGANYTVTLIVTDANGLKDTATKIIYVLVAQAVNNTVRICSPQTSTTIVALDPSISGVSGIWFTSSSGVISTPSNDTTIISNLISGTYLFFWVVSDGTCSDADQVTVIVDQPVVVNAGPDQAVCTSPGTATMAASNPSPGTGLWTTTSAATISNPVNRNTTISGLTVPGTYVFVWTVTNGACVNRDTMNIVVSNSTSAAAGADQLRCASPGTATLAATNPSPASGLWTTTSSATITNPTSPSATVSGLTTAGVYTFIWTVTNGGCLSRDTMLITVTAVIVSNAGSNQQVCTTTASGTLSGNNPSPGTGVWTALNGGTITNPNTNVTTVTGLSTAGSYNFVWTITNGPCVSTDTVLFIVRSPVIANAGADQLLCNATTAILTGNSPSPGTGAWTTTGGATIASPSSATTNVSGLAVGLNTFIYTTTYGACISRDTIVITVTTLGNANAGPDIQICETQTSVTMAGNTPSSGSGVWTQLNGGTITSPTSPTTTITNLSPGNYSFVWTITSGICTSRDTVVVTVDVQVASTAGTDQQICQGEVVFLFGNDPSPATGEWTTTSNGIFTNPNDPFTLVVALVDIGTFDFVWTITNGGCVSSDTVAITVDSSVVTDAGPDQNLCALTTSTLAAVAPGSGSGTWSSLGTAIVSNVNLANSGVTNLAVGSNLFVWTTTNGNCINTDTVNIFVSASVTASAGPDQQICVSSPTVTLSGNAAAPGAGVWTTTSSATIANPTNPSTSVSGLSTAGNYNFIWTITNGACVSRDTIRVTVSANVIANAGPDQSICNATSATLNGNSAAPGSGLWTSTTGGIITSNSNPNSGVTGLIVGTNTFVWTITNGSCVTRDTVNIEVSTNVAANAGIDQQICSPTSSLALSGNSPSSGTGIWSTTSTAIISNPTNPSTTVSGLNTAGIYNFIWTVTNGACVNTDTVQITVNANIISNAGPDQNLCNVTTATLSGNATAPGSGLWTSTTGGIITSNTNPNSGVTGLIVGTNTFVWTITNGSCVTRDTVNIIISNLIVSNAGPDQQLCFGSSVILAGNTPSSGTGNWTALNGGVFSNASTPNATVTGLSSAGVYSFVWTVTNGACISTDTVVITLNQNVVANAGADQNLCNAASTTLNGNIPSVGTGTWTTSSSAVIVSPSSPTSLVNGLMAGTYSFIWTIVNGSCTTRDTVLITVDTLIVADAGIDQSICFGNVAFLAANSPAFGIGEWTTTSSGIIADPNDPNTIIIGLVSFGNFDFVWTITNGACVSSDTMVIQVDTAQIANAGVDQSLCETFTGTLNAIASITGSGSWTSLGVATVASPTSANSSVSNLVYGPNEFLWTFNNGGCSSEDTVVIFVDSIILANAGVDQLACSSALITLSGNSPSSGTGIWTSLGAAIVDNPTTPNSTVSNLQIGINSFVWSIINGACVQNDTVDIAISSLPIAAAGSDQFVTTGTIVVLGGTPAASGGTGPYTYEWNPGLALDDSLIANPTVTASITTTYLLTVTDSLGCSSTSSMTLWVNDPPIVVNDTTSTSEDTTVTIFVLNNDSDPNNNIDTNALGILQGPFNGIATVDPAGHIIYTPNPNFNGIDSILYVICDDGVPVYCDSAWIIITINPVNDAPLAVDDYATTPEDSCIQIAILGNDTDVENMIDLNTLVILSGPSNGTYSLDPLTGILTYCPDTNFNGTDTLIYAICDSGYPTPILCDTALVIITITPVNDLPIAQSDSAIVCGGDVLIVNVRTNDFDQEGDTLSVSVYTQGSQGLASVGANNEIIYAANFNASGWDSLQYVACDQQIPAGCDTAWLYIYIHPLPQVTSTVTPVLCGGDSIGAIDITLSPAGTYSFTWSNGSTDEDVDSLTVGIYTVSILDSNGCVLTYLDTVPGPLLPLSGTTVSQDILCFGDNNGTIDIQISGGTTPYSYSWSNGSSDEDLDSLVAGIYTVIVTDTNACVYTLTDTIIAPSAALSLVLTSNDVVCAGDSSGSISVAVTGGTPGYSYSWSNGSLTDSLNSIQAGIYTVLVTDSNACTISMTDTIFELNTPIVLNATVVDPNCSASAFGNIQISVNGGVMPYGYLWNTGDTTANLDSLPAGFYQLLITDSVGCNVVGGYTLIDTSSVSILLSGSSVFCELDSAVLSVAPVSGFTYQWMLNGSALPNDTTPQLVATQAGDYSITASAGCGTFTDGPITLTVNPLPSVDAGLDENVSCDVELTLFASGALNYSWSPANLCITPNQSSTIVNTNDNHTYTVIGTDANGCSAMDSVFVKTDCNVIDPPTGFSPNNDGINDYFEISNIDKYPFANLRIFNRWGALVYERNNYDNSWSGLSNVDKIGIGEVLPNGTYYYILDLGNDEKPLNGYVIIRR